MSGKNWKNLTHYIWRIHVEITTSMNFLCVSSEELWKGKLTECAVRLDSRGENEIETTNEVKLILSPCFYALVWPFGSFLSANEINC